MSTHKGSRHRTDSEDFKKYQNSKIWDNFKNSKKAQEEAKEQGVKLECGYCGESLGVDPEYPEYGLHCLNEDCVDLSKLR